MIKFFLTNHAKIRMEERNVPFPDHKKVIPAGKRNMRRIQKSCKKYGFKRDWGGNTLYFVNGNYVYVCETRGVGKYQVITTFEVKE